MGAVYNQLVFEGTLTKEQVISKVQDVILDCQWESGHGGYSGTFAEAQGVTVLNKTFPTRKAARRYLDGYQDEQGEWNDGYAQKWGPAVAVRVVQEDGQTAWVVGALCSE